MISLLVTYGVASLFAPLFVIGYRHRAYGKEFLKMKGGAFVASNHVSFLDPPLIGFSMLPIRLCYLARDTLFTPFLGWILKNIRCYPVKRGKGNLALFKLIPELTSQGNKVVLFPEGTRSVDGEFQPGQLGIALLVQKAKVPVIPCYVHGTFAVWGPKKKWPKLWGKTAVIFGRPIDFSYLEGGDKKQEQQEIVDTIMRAIAALKDWYLAGAKGPLPSFEPYKGNKGSEV